MECLFVYGTLLNCFDHEVIKPLRPYLQLQGTGTLKGRLYDLGSYPGFVEANDGYDVLGEIYQVQEPQKVLEVLDDYEGNEYIRKRLNVQLQGFRDISCWVYVYRDTLLPDYKEIINGDYLAFVRKKNNG